MKYTANNQRSLINSLTEVTHRKITLDRLLIDDPIFGKILSQDPDEIRQQTRSFYKHQFGARNVKWDELSDEWKDQYAPLGHVQDHFYDQLLAPIIVKDVDEVIGNLPNNKAPGPSDIVYEFVKRLKTH